LVPSWLARHLPALHRYHRQPSQNLVEFGLSVAAIAFVALLGFGALGRAQAAYWGAEAPKLAAPTPASTDFLHDTFIDPTSCLNAFSGPILVGTTVTCSTTVSDMNTPDYERKPPNGTIDWIIDGVPQPAPCSGQPGASPQGLPVLTAGALNQCGSPFSLPTACSLSSPPSCATTATAHTLVVKYTPTSNHNFSQFTVPFTVVPNLQWSAFTCTNDLTGTVGATSVEVGHPLRCGITLGDGSRGGGVYQPPPVGTQIDWSVPTYSSGAPNFTCVSTSVAPAIPSTSTPATLMQAPGMPCASAAASYACYTDNAGKCQVDYRHMYDANSGGVGNTLTFNLKAHDYSAPTNVYTSPAVHITSGGHNHPTEIVVLCVGTDSQPSPHVLTVNQRPVGDPDTVFGNATFGVQLGPSVAYGGTRDLDIANPPYTTTLNCAAFVYDTSDVGNYNPAVVGSTNPLMQEAFPPAGVVTFDWYSDGVTPGVVAGQCQLTPIPFSLLPLQSPTQAPFVSTCQASVTLTNGTTTPSKQPFLNASYMGEPSGATHTAAWSPEQLPASAPGGPLGLDNDGNPLPGYRIRVDFR
jgi:hypothetical protein